MKDEDTTRTMRSAGDAWAVGIQLALLLTGCTLGGWHLGRKAGWPRLGLVVGAVAGFLLTLYEVWKLSRRLGLMAPSAPASPDGKCPSGQGQGTHE